MRAQLRSEFYKLRSARVSAGVLTAMIALVSFAVLLHGFGLSVTKLSGLDDQRGVFVDVGVNLGAVFAALLGALSITGEIRSGTIRPTLLVTPQRTRVIAAKAVAALVTGFVVGVIAAGVAGAIGSLALAGRGLTIRLGAGGYLQLIIGGGVAGALWAVLGLSVGAVVRAQVPTIVALFAWLLFVENLFADLPGAHRFVPGALAQAVAGQQRDGTLHTPALAVVLLGLYTAAAFVAGRTATTRRDFA